MTNGKKTIYELSDRHVSNWLIRKTQYKQLTKFA